MTSTCLLVADGAAVANLLALVPDQDVIAVVVGPRELADQVATTGVALVRWAPLPGAAPAGASAGAVAELVAAAAPQVVLASTRPADRVLAGAVAARLGATLLTSVTALTPAEGGGPTEVDRYVHGGVARQTVVVDGPVVIVTDGGGTPDAGAAAPVEEVPAEMSAGMTVVATEPAPEGGADLARARRIVAVGRGVRAREDLAMVEQLATALGAEVACSRPLAEGQEWFGHDRYVGVTGRQVAPDLYLAVGISGQLQHVVGARGAGTVVAINSDPQAPYLAEADYCLVGDLYDLVPALTRVLG